MSRDPATNARWLVARRELSERMRTRAFRVATAIQVAIVVIVLIIAAVTGGGSKHDDVGLVGPAAQSYAPALRAAGPALGATVRTHVLPSAAAAERQVHDGGLDAAVVDGRSLIVKSDPGSTLAAVVQSVGRQLALRDALTRAGVGGAQLRQALAPAPLTVRALSPQAKDHNARRGIATLAIVLVYLAVFTYGLWVAGGVVEEKSSRVIEVVLSAIRPRELLVGKILGLGALGLLQFALVIVVGLVGASVTNAVHLPSATGGAAALIALWFVLGYALYACGYAIAGALVSRSEDLQSSSGPLNMVTIGAYLIAFIGSSNASGPLMTVASFVPLTAPMAMPARWLLTDVPAWQLLVSVALTLAATVLLLRVATRVYSASVLRLGPRVSLRAALAARRA